MILEKGDPNNLEGKILSYVYNLAKDEPKYPTICGFTNPIDNSEFIKFLNKTGAPESLKKIIKEEKGIIMSCYGIGISIEKKEELDKLIEKFNNVYNAGKAVNLDMAKEILDSVLKVYFLNYSAQLIEKMQGDLEFKKTEFLDHYKNYNGEDLKKKLYQFSGDLITSIDKKDRESQARIVNEFKHFVKNSDFLSDAVKIVESARSDKERKLDLINMYIEKIVAIYTEEYEKATEYKKKIEIFNN